MNTNMNAIASANGEDTPPRVDVTFQGSSSVVLHISVTLLSRLRSSATSLAYDTRELAEFRELGVGKRRGE